MTPKREICIRFDPEIWSRMDDKRHLGRYKWQGLGELLFRQWLEFGLVTEQLDVNDWRVQALQEILNSANVTATAALEAHLISLTLLVRKANAPGDYSTDSDTHALERVSDTLQRVRAFASGVRSSQPETDCHMQERTA